MRWLFARFVAKNTLIIVSAAATLFTFTVAFSQSEEGEFSAHGSGVIRIENEVKIRVPDAQTEKVWSYLVKRYADCSWLNRNGSEFQSTLGDENFTDTYFDTPNLQVLNEKGGIRFRTRHVISGSAMSKDERRLIQIKLNRDDSSGLARSEIKFDVVSNYRDGVNDSKHPFLGKVKRSQVSDCVETLSDLGIDASALRPILTIDQNRRRVYLQDQDGAFATLTLDMCSTQSWKTDLRWVEIELELNEIRYTEASEEQRIEMIKVVDQIQADLVSVFPELVQDQNPKYNKAFEMIEAATWAPARMLFGLGVTLNEALLFIVIVVTLLLATGIKLVQIARTRARKSS